ncbi:Mov34/MPN/PAD-1 family protein [Flavobacterium hercynium]|uniref:Mov34/MPN/PAD-1 family protein n=1 Tax=Flavobacterium hercynium TaxID=387094 RepID=UPI002403712C|nr:Mov34/MPN/PAD-1 family protein [Flavobacterium hercynium]SMP15208.1 integrative and conjugative element protein, VC0181 family [Flavobacterium hercynium]
MIEFNLGNLFVKISRDVLANLKKYIQDDLHKPESGGVLIGFYIEDNIYSITDVSFPSSYDKSSRYNFTRSIKNAQNVLDDFFKKSNGKKIYLGEWHTHPEDFPMPSSLDEESILQQIRGNILNSKVIFMVIIGRKGIYISSVDKNGIKTKNKVKFHEI